VKKYPILSMGLTFTINILADRLTKVWAVNQLQGKSPVGFLNDLVVIGYAENSGAFLSMGANWPMPVKYILLLVLPIATCLGILVYCFLKERNIVKIILITSFAAGGLGNLVDRLFNNFTVIDFLNFGIGSIRTGILNIADISITFAAIIYVVYELWEGRKAKQAASAGE
jgi:signal peptidase II